MAIDYDVAGWDSFVSNILPIVENNQDHEVDLGRVPVRRDLVHVGDLNVNS